MLIKSKNVSKLNNHLRVNQLSKMNNAKNGVNFAKRGGFESKDPYIDPKSLIIKTWAPVLWKP